MPDFLPPRFPPIFDLSDVTDEDVANAINRLSSTRACRTDSITAFMIKSGKSELITGTYTHFQFKYQEKEISQQLEKCQGHAFIQIRP